MGCPCVSKAFAYIVKYGLNVFVEHMESVFVEIDKSAFYISHRPPNSDSENFNEHLGRTLN